MHAPHSTTLFDHDKIASAASMRELADIAIETLKKLSNFGLIHQLCGPMSTGGYNSREANIKLFTFAISVAQSKGLIVFDQIPFQHAMARLSNHAPQGNYKQDILDHFYLPVFQSGLVNKVFFLPLWNTSRGAIWERNTLNNMGTLIIEDYPIDWYKEALEMAHLSFPLFKN